MNDVPVTGEVLSESDFKALRSLLDATPKGRAFLEIHARQTRSEEARMVLEAIRRFEGTLPELRSPVERDCVLDEIDGVREAAENICRIIDERGLDEEVSETLCAEIATLYRTIDAVSEILGVRSTRHEMQHELEIDVEADDTFLDHDVDFVESETEPDAA